MTWDGPNLPVDLTLTTASEPLTWTRSRLECSAWTLTALKPRPRPGQRLGGGDLDAVAARVLGLDSDGALRPGTDGDRPPEVVHIEAGAGPHRNRGVRLGQRRGRRDRQNRDHAALLFSSACR